LLAFVPFSTVSLIVFTASSSKNTLEIVKWSMFERSSGSLNDQFVCFASKFLMFTLPSFPTRHPLFAMFNTI